MEEENKGKEALTIAQGPKRATSLNLPNNHDTLREVTWFSQAPVLLSLSDPKAVPSLGLNFYC